MLWFQVKTSIHTHNWTVGDGPSFIPLVLNRAYRHKRGTGPGTGNIKGRREGKKVLPILFPYLSLTTCPWRTLLPKTAFHVTAGQTEVHELLETQPLSSRTRIQTQICWAPKPGLLHLLYSVPESLLISIQRTQESTMQSGLWLNIEVRATDCECYRLKKKKINMIGTNRIGHSFLCLEITVRELEGQEYVFAGQGSKTQSHNTNKKSKIKAQKFSSSVPHTAPLRICSLRQGNACVGGGWTRSR